VATEGGERREIEMAAKPSQGEWAGWFQGRFLAPKPGDYKLELPIPSSADVLRGKFAVKESNPELDNTRPDPAAMAAMASELSELNKGEIKEAYEVLQSRLRGPKASAADKLDPKAERSAAEGESPKLLFMLSTADLIPPCLTAVPPKVSRNRGPVDDLWDHGPTLGHTDDGKPIDVATLTAAIHTLLSPGGANATVSSPAAAPPPVVGGRLGGEQKSSMSKRPRSSSQGRDKKSSSRRRAVASAALGAVVTGQPQPAAASSRRKRTRTGSEKVSPDSSSAKSAPKHRRTGPKAV